MRQASKPEVSLLAFPKVREKIPGLALQQVVSRNEFCYPRKLHDSGAIFITGQIKSQFLKLDLSIRQVGFQETDICSIVKLITK